MSQRPTLCLLGLLLALSVPPAMAQDLSDSERAKRDAAKVFNFIKFHAVRAKSAPVAAAVPVAATAAAAPVARPRAETAKAEAEPVKPTAVAQLAAAPAPAAMLETQPGTSLPPQTEPAPVAAAPVPAAQPEPEPEEIELKLVHHVQPELPRGNNLRDGTVRVRFTVEADGRVSKAVTANEGVQRRLANAATRAIEQWRFAPISQAQEVEVDIDFRFE